MKKEQKKVREKKGEGKKKNRILQGWVRAPAISVYFSNHTEKGFRAKRLTWLQACEYNGKVERLDSSSKGCAFSQNYETILLSESASDMPWKYIRRTDSPALHRNFLFTDIFMYLSCSAFCIALSNHYKVYTLSLSLYLSIYLSILLSVYSFIIFSF